MPAGGKPLSKIEFTIQICVEPDDDGFHAYCPALKGLHTSGATEDEAVSNAKDAAIAYLMSLIQHHDPIPIGLNSSREGDATLAASACPRHFVEHLALAPA